MLRRQTSETVSVEFTQYLRLQTISKPRAYNNDKCISNSTPVVHQFNPRLATDHPIHLYLFNFTLSGLDACAHGLYLCI